MSEKLTALCDHIELVNLTPKGFITAFLNHSAESFAFCRRFWGSKTGWESTRRLLDAIYTLVTASSDGRGHWNQWILDQVSQPMDAIHINSANG